MRDMIITGQGVVNVWTVKTIKGKYSHQGIGETTFDEFDDYEEARAFYKSIPLTPDMTVVFIPTENLMSWEEIERLMSICA